MDENTSNAISFSSMFVCVSVIVVSVASCQKADDKNKADIAKTAMEQGCVQKVIMTQNNNIPTIIWTKDFKKPDLSTVEKE